MKKKLLSVLLVVVMTAGLLAGCKKANSVSEPKGDSTESKITESVKPDSNQTDSAGENYTDENGNTYFTDADGVKWYVDEDGTKYKTFDDVVIDYLICWNGGGPKITKEAQYNSAVAEEIRKKIGVTVTGEGILSNEIEKLNMMFASAEVPTMVNAAWWGGSSGETTTIQKAIDDGMVLDITDLVPQYENISDCWDVGVISQAFLMSEVDKKQNEGRRYIMPCQLAGSEADIDYTPEGVFVRKDVAEALNIDPSQIKTSEQLLDFMKKADAYGFKDVNGNDTITVGCGKNGFKYVCYMQNFNNKKFAEFTMNEDGSISYDRLSQNFIDKHMFMWELVNSGMMDVECFTQNIELADQKFSNGSYLFTAGHLRSTLKCQEDSGVHATNPDMEYVVVGPLEWADGSAGSMIKQQGEYGCPVTFFSADADEEQIEAALTWLNYVNGKEGYRLLNFGIEGEDYILTDDGKITYPDEIIKLYNEDRDTYNNQRNERFPGLSGDAYITENVKEWFGSDYSIAAQTGNIEWSRQKENEFKEVCPLEIIEGLSVSAIASTYQGYTDLLANALDDVRMKEYTERAYFADTEEEAIAILKDYQKFISNYNNGELQTFLDWLAGAIKEYEAQGITIAY